MEENETVSDVARYQALVAELRDKLCGGNNSELARRIGRDASYVTRLLYPIGRPGRKGFGLTIIDAFNRAFSLPAGFWNLNPPELSPLLVERIRQRMTSRNNDAHGVLSTEDDVPMFSRRGGDVALSAMEPIRAWEHEGDLPAGEYAMVPRLEVKLSAGPGSGANQLTFDFDDGQLRAYSTEWIRAHHLKPNKLRVMKGSGRSMEPTIFDGDDLLINLAETEIVDGRVYALWYEGGERVKRLYRMPGGGLRIRSDNATDFPEIILGPEYTGHVRVIGRVIDRSGPGGL